MGKDSKAIKSKGKLLSFFPTGEYYFTKGLKAYHRRDFEKAKRYLQRALQLEPGEPMIACQLALVWTEIGEYTNSNRLLHMILDELDPHMNECHYFLANNYAHLGFFKDATRHSRLYLELEPDGEFYDDSEDLLELLVMESGDDEDEDDWYQEDDLMIRQEEARNLLETGYFPKAIEMLKGIVEEYPTYWSAYNNLALAHFYMGEAEVAESVLADVLERNPGNLHALCNLLVFAHYKRETEEKDRLIAVLRKVKPMMSEHQFKLGATFALAGEYELAFEWLKRLYKYGFEGDGPFYYWFAHSAYFTGREELARSIWKKVIEINPDKEGSEPWNETASAGMEDLPRSILQKMDSEYLEERLFALFLASLSTKRDELLSSREACQNGKFTVPEKEYLAFLKCGKPTFMAAAHETAEMFYDAHQPIGALEAGLYLMWFAVAAEAKSHGLDLKNKKAWAAATEYVWFKYKNEHMTMAELGGRYGLSAATVGKYVKLVDSCLLL
ncbi:tetratricopeptide repeat protein [Bacillus sp. EB01]|uniref:tetratricopeptide repeat protein n=1 Tax=Bacillus sp. EB01 TaxID=1347086 RepID=UPI0005C502FD|nr:tetratricopeptide repeat protein [Bacillus sp. EB01]